MSNNKNKGSNNNSITKKKHKEYYSRLFCGWLFTILFIEIWPLMLYGFYLIVDFAGYIITSGNYSSAGDILKELGGVTVWVITRFSIPGIFIGLIWAGSSDI